MSAMNKFSLLKTINLTFSLPLKYIFLAKLLADLKFYGMKYFFILLLCIPGILPPVLAQRTSLNQRADVSDLFEKLNLSVVTIQTTEFKVKDAQLRSAESIGSGVLIDEKGWVMTAAHVVESANQITVKLEDNQAFKADIIKSVPGADVALLKLQNPPGNLLERVAKIGDTKSLKIGQQIMVIGAPFGLEHSLSIGYVSGRMQRNRVLNGEAIDFIQTDAAINHGNSGGPMFNMNGEVIGIVSFILSEGGGFDGIGFGVDINSAKKVLLENNTFWTGFDGIFLSEGLAGILNVPQSSGLLVQRVTKDSFAESLGIRGGFFQAEILGQKLWLGGDIILSIQGTSCETPHNLNDIRSQINRLQKGQAVKMKILRQGKILELETSM